MSEISLELEGNSSLASVSWSSGSFCSWVDSGPPVHHTLHPALSTHLQWFSWTSQAFEFVAQEWEYIIIHLKSTTAMSREKKMVCAIDTGLWVTSLTSSWLPAHTHPWPYHTKFNFVFQQNETLFYLSYSYIFKTMPCMCKWQEVFIYYKNSWKQRDTHS